MEGVLLYFLPNEATVNSEVYAKALKELKHDVQRACPDSDMTELLFLPGHTSAWIAIETVSLFGWTVRP